VAHIKRKGNYSEEAAKRICGRLQQQLEGKHGGWIEERAWTDNDRVFSGYITADRVDKQAERIPLEKFMTAMTSYLRTGKLIDGHTNQIRGEPLAWKVEGSRILVKFGVYSRMPGDDKFWDKVKIFGKKGSLSIGGEPVGGKQVICEGSRCHIEPKGVDLFEVSFVENHPANRGARVKEVNVMAKGVSDRVKDLVARRRLKRNSFVVDMAKSRITEEDLDAIFDKCAACQEVVQRFERAGFKPETARAYAKEHILNELQSALSDIMVNPASPEAGSTTRHGSENVEEKDMEEIAKRVVELLKQEEAPEEGAPPPEEEGEAGGERDLAADVDALTGQVSELAGIVSSLAEKLTGTEESVEEEAEEAAAVEEEAGEPPAEQPAAAEEPGLDKGKETPKKPPEEPAEEPETKKIEQVEKELNELRKSLHLPARPSRGRVPAKPGGSPETLAGPVSEIIVKAVNASKKRGVPSVDVMLDGADQLLNA
jgi:hypothetical protein